MYNLGSGSVESAAANAPTSIRSGISNSKMARSSVSVATLESRPASGRILSYVHWEVVETRPSWVRERLVRDKEVEAVTLKLNFVLDRLYPA